MTKLTEIVSGLVVPQTEELDFPLEARAPSKAQAPKVVPSWKGRAPIEAERIEAIPQAEPKPVKAKPSGRTQEEYYQAVRKLTRRPVGREVVTEGDRVETVMGIVGNLRRKDQQHG